MRDAHEAFMNEKPVFYIRKSGTIMILKRMQKTQMRGSSFSSYEKAAGFVSLFDNSEHSTFVARSPYESIKKAVESKDGQKREIFICESYKDFITTLIANDGKISLDIAS